MMRAFKNPGFQERRSSAEQARSKALALYRNRPAVDPAVLAERIARQERRVAGEEAKRSALRQAKAEAETSARAHVIEVAALAEAAAQQKATDTAQARADAIADKVAQRNAWTEEDRKAARDARYAARKVRQGRR